MNGGTYSLTSIRNGRFFEKFFHGNFIYSLRFCHKSAERKSPNKYFLYFIFDDWRPGIRTWAFESNKSTTISMREGHVWECTYTSGRNEVIGMRTITFVWLILLDYRRTRQSRRQSVVINQSAVAVACLNIWVVFRMKYKCGLYWVIF